MIQLVRSCPTDFKEYYIQMQAAKRSQAPLAAQVTCASHSCCFVLFSPTTNHSLMYSRNALDGG